MYQTHLASFAVLVDINGPQVSDGSILSKDSLPEEVQELIT